MVTESNKDEIQWLNGWNKDELICSMNVDLNQIKMRCSDGDWIK